MSHRGRYSGLSGTLGALLSISSSAVALGNMLNASRALIKLSNGACWDSELIKAGRYKVQVLSFDHYRDDNFEIGFDTTDGLSWKLNAIILNKVF